MPPVRPRRSGKFRVVLGFVVIAALVALLWAGRSLGHILHHQDPLDRADAILVLGGSWLARTAEGGDLYLEGRAPLVLLLRELPDYGEEALRARGIDVPGVTDVQVQALVGMGVPREAIEILEPQETTASEAARIAQLSAARGWRTIIVVTAKLHTARARLVITRHLAGSQTRVLMRGTRYDPADVDRWWDRRTDIRSVLIEGQKLLAYWIGVAD